MKRLGSCTTMIAAMLVTACNLAQAPVVELTGVRVRGIGFRGATILAQLSIENPNRFAIESDSVTFQFEARDPRNQSWEPVTSGTNVQRVRVEKGARAVVEIPIDFPYSNLRAPIRSIIERGVLDYRISGRVFVRKPLRKGVPFSDEGSLSLAGDR
jgi:LEA14-like dessication related protein